MLPSSLPAPLVSIVIPAFNKWAFTKRCLESLRQHAHAGGCEIIVVDDASSDETAAGLAAFPDVRTLRNAQNLGFARSVNAGVRLALGKYLLLLNNDTQAQAPFLPAMLAVLQRVPQAAAVGCKLVFPDGSIQHGGVGFSYAGPDPITVFHVDHGQRTATFAQALAVSAVTAACMLLRPEVFWQVGGLDEGYLNGHEDVDLCLKLREAGHLIVYLPSVQLVHHESVSEGRFDASWVNLDRFGARWIGRFHAFDVDFRKTVPVAPVDAARGGVLVVVPVADAYGTVAACLESVMYTTGPQDEVVIVDDHATGATQAFLRTFAAAHPQVKFVAADCHGFIPAAVQGLGVGQKRWAAVLAPNMKAAPGWLDRLVAHGHASPGNHMISAAWGDPTGLPLLDLIHPPVDPDPVRFHGAPTAPGDLQVHVPVAMPLVFGDRMALHSALNSYGSLHTLQAVRANDVRAFALDAPMQPTFARDDYLTACVRTDVLTLSEHLPRYASVAEALSARDNHDFVCLIEPGVWLPKGVPVVATLLAALLAAPDFAAVAPTLPLGSGPQRNGRGLYVDAAGLQAFGENHALRHTGTLVAVPLLETAMLVLRKPVFAAWAQTARTSKSLAEIVEAKLMKLGVAFAAYVHHEARRGLPMHGATDACSQP